jgi:hypothetical protein
MSALRLTAFVSVQTKGYNQTSASTLRLTVDHRTRRMLLIG